MTDHTYKASPEHVEQQGLRGLVISIDGPAGSGKSSTARAVAAELGYAHLDSGAFYRAITYALLAAGVLPETWEALSTVDLDQLQIGHIRLGRHVVPTVQGTIVEDKIRSREVSAFTPILASVPHARLWLLGKLREFGRGGSLVADGRDIGTVVFPDAQLKIFLVCDPEERARRRLRDHGHQEIDTGLIEEEMQHLHKRDRQDQDRSHAPLLPAYDAIVLDTTGMSFRDQVERIVGLARERGVDRGEQKP